MSSTRPGRLLTGDLENLSPAVDTALYRIAQEAVTNALRHARHATQVNVIDSRARWPDGDPGAGRRRSGDRPSLQTALASLMRKLNARNRVEIAMWAYETHRIAA